MNEVGSLVAATGRYNGGIWLYRVTKTTAKLVYVELVEQPKRRTYGPANGRSPNQYLHADQAIPVRDMDHFAAIVKARATYEQTSSDIDGTAQAKHRANFERYQAAIA